MIEDKYKPQAAAAADALRTALLAVEDCGADVELTNIVVGLSDARTKLCTLFGLPVDARLVVLRRPPCPAAGGTDRRRDG